MLLYFLEFSGLLNINLLQSIHFNSTIVSPLHTSDTINFRLTATNELPS